MAWTNKYHRASRQRPTRERERSELEKLADKLCRRFSGQQNIDQRAAIRQFAATLDGLAYLMNNAKSTSLARAIGELIDEYNKQVE